MIEGTNNIPQHYDTADNIVTQVAQEDHYIMIHDISNVSGDNSRICWT